MNRHELRFQLWARSLAATWGINGFALIWQGHLTEAGFFLPVFGPFRCRMILGGRELRADRTMVSRCTGIVLITHFAWATANDPLETLPMDKTIGLIPGDTLNATFRLRLRFGT